MDLFENKCNEKIIRYYAKKNKDKLRRKFVKPTVIVVKKNKTMMEHVKKNKKIIKSGCKKAGFNFLSSCITRPRIEDNKSIVCSSTSN